MVLTEDQKQIITDHPLNDLLAALPTKLRHVKLEDNEDDTRPCDNQAWRADICNLLGILMGTTAAYQLRTSDGHRIASMLMHARQVVGTLQPSRFRSLIDAIVADCSDLVL